MNLVRYTGTGEWSALYVDGILDRVGDHYIIDDRISELTGVEEVQSDDFLRGGDGRASVAPSLYELGEYSKARAQREDSALELRKKATAMLAEAERLEGLK
jgi:hypothetical protein